MTPTKVIDTRSGTGLSSSGPLTSGESVEYVPATALGLANTLDVASVYVAVTALSPSTSGCLVDYGSDDSNPGVCNVSFQEGQTVTETDIVDVGDDGGAVVTNQSSGTTGLAVTILGYYTTGNGDQTSAGDTYVGLPETSVLDTRGTIGGHEGEVGAGDSVSVDIAGTAGVPSDAAGIAAYIGATGATASGYVDAYATGTSDPGYSDLTYQSGETDRDLYMGPLGTSGALTLTNEGSVSTNLIIDVIGYYVSPTATEAGDTYTQVPSSRILDTRNSTAVAANGTVTFTATGTDNIPSSGVGEVAETVSALSPTATGWLSVYPGGGTDSDNPVVNFVAGDNEDNDLDQAVVDLSNTGTETIANHSSGTVQVVVDARGYFSAPSAPNPPEDVDADISGTTGTITWAAPEVDGGAAITGYTVDVYDPNDNLVSSTTTAGNVYSTTVTGLNAADDYTADVTATNAVGTSTAGSDSLESGTASDAADATNFDQNDQVFSVNSSTGAVTMDSSTESQGTIDSDGAMDPTETSSPAVTVYTGTETNPDTNTGFACVQNTAKGNQINFDGSFNNNQQGTSHAGKWTHDIYEVNDARYNNAGGYETMQFMLCGVGTSSASNGWHQYFVGDAMYAEVDADHVIGWKSGLGATSTNDASTTLGFQLSLGDYGSISASTTVTGGVGSLDGDVGNDGRFPGFPSADKQYHDNRWNDYWHSSDGWSWDGTGDPEGNTGEVLYSWPQEDISVTFADEAEVEAFCAPIECSNW